MSDNKLLDLSFEFAVAIVNLIDSVSAPKSSYMTDQLARAGTSVGANIHEAQYAHSKKDFTAPQRETNKKCPALGCTFIHKKGEKEICRIDMLAI